MDFNRKQRRAAMKGRWPFKGNVFPSVAFNMGPRVETFRHKDQENFAPGWCAVTALGDFDPTKGGHLVLWELGLIIEFPPGSTILIPSALISHSNTTIGEGETRMSIAQYAPAGLFRWTAYGLKTKGYAEKEDPEAYAAMEAERSHALESYIGLYSTLEEIQSMR
jgi:hypothetical protein